MESIEQSGTAMQEEFWTVLQNEARAVMERVVNRAMDLERMAFLGAAPYERSAARRGRRNGFDRRVVDSRWGPLRLRMPKVRESATRFRTRILRAYQRRQRHLEACAVEWAACGMSTRAASRQLSRAFGAILSAGTISNLAGRLDAEIESFRNRPIRRGHRCVYLDGKHGKISGPGRRRGRGRARKAVLLLAWGIRHDGSEELIGYWVAPDESEESWDRFLRSLRERGLVEENRWGERLERIVSDGDAGLAAALALNYPKTPHQVCVFHKVKNLLGDLNDRSRKGAIQGEAGQIFEARTRAEALARLERWTRRWKPAEPVAVAHFIRDIDRMTLFYESPPALRRRVKTSNPIERFIRELNRKFERVGVFPSARSWERMTYLVYRQLVAQGYRPLQRKSAFTRTS